MHRTLGQRFWAKVHRVNDATSCWNWLAGTQDGYGKFNDGIRNERAHRVAYRLTYGAIPKGQLIRHRCDNRKCCRPDHLLLGTIQHNMQDMMSRGRQARGERKANAKLTEAVVLDVRQRHAAGEALAALALQLGVSSKLLSQVCCGDIWKHVGGPRRERRTFA